MIALLNQVPSETKIKKHLRQLIFGKNLFCPFCHSRQVSASENRYRCRCCRKPFTLLSGTWLNNMKLSYRTLWALLWCWTQRIPVEQSQKLCHVSQKSVYHWFRHSRPDEIGVNSGGNPVGGKGVWYFLRRTGQAFRPKPENDIVN